MCSIPKVVEVTTPLIVAVVVVEILIVAALMHVIHASLSSPVGSVSI